MDSPFVPKSVHLTCNLNSAPTLAFFRVSDIHKGATNTVSCT